MPDANRYKSQAINGEYGNLCGEESSYVAAALGIGQVINFVKLPVGAVLIDVTLINDALGASSTIALGEVFDSTADGTNSANSILVATSTASAARTESKIHPITYDLGPVTIQGVVGGGPITGKVTCTVRYRYNGTK
jgi:hypothetical protein